MANLDWDLRNCLSDIGATNWLVLTTLILHANERNRCWPSTNQIRKVSGIGSNSTVKKAKDWLEKHKAIRIVDYEERAKEEKHLPERLHIYQLTGIVEIDGKVYDYLHIANNQFKAEVTQTVTSEVTPSVITVSVTKDNTDIEDDTTIDTKVSEELGSSSKKSHIISSTNEDDMNEKENISEFVGEIDTDGRPAAAQIDPLGDLMAKRAPLSTISQKMGWGLFYALCGYKLGKQIEFDENDKPTTSISSVAYFANLLLAGDERPNAQQGKISNEQTLTRYFYEMRERYPDFIITSDDIYEFGAWWDRTTGIARPAHQKFVGEFFKYMDEKMSKKQEVAAREQATIDRKEQARRARELYLKQLQENE